MAAKVFMPPQFGLQPGLGQRVVMRGVLRQVGGVDLAQSPQLGVDLADAAVDSGHRVHVRGTRRHALIQLALNGAVTRVLGPVVLDQPAHIAVLALARCVVVERSVAHW